MPKFTIKPYVVNIPMAKPFKHAGFSRTHSDSVIVHISGSGYDGYGECAPRKYVTGETVSSVKDELTLWIDDNIQSLSLDGISGDIEEKIRKTITELNIEHPNTHCAIELALIDWLEKLTGRPFLPSSLHHDAQFVPVIDGFGRLSTSDLILKKAKIVKMKSGSNITETCERISSLRKRTDAVILVDANNDWSGDVSLSNVKECLSSGAEWFEEPSSPNDYTTLQKIRMLGAKVLLDESIINENDLVVAINNSAIDGVNIRVSKCGGIVKAKNISKTALELNVERYYGVQVAETGTLITAGRILSLSDDNPLGIEAGQSDLFFDSSSLWVENSFVDRTKGIVIRPQNNMLNGRIPL